VLQDAPPHVFESMLIADLWESTTAAAMKVSVSLGRTVLAALRAT
jgi:hypothetical protein